MNADPVIDAAIGWRPGDDIWLESQNYFMRTLKPEDATARMLAWWADPAVMVPLGETARTYSREEVAEYFRRFDTFGNFLLGIFVKDTGLHIGWRTIELSPKLRKVRTHLAVGDASYRGRGVNAELQNAVYDFTFYSLGAKSMVATVFADNMPMRRRAERTGYRADAKITESFTASDGITRDVMVYRLSERDWRAKRKWIVSTRWRAGSRIASLVA